jgi:FkbM family methyltransferase
MRRADEIVRCALLSPEWASLALGYLGLAKLGYPRTFSTRQGDRLRLENMHDLITAWIIFFRREYSVLPDARVIVDAGANIGAFSLYAARQAPHARIVALEPFPSTASRLRSTIEANGLASRIVWREWALGASDGLARMDDAAAPSQSRGLLADGTANGLPVETLSLGTFFERERLDHVDLLKMDIEGSEHQVFSHAPPDVLRRVDRIALEYHPNGSKASLFDRLRSAGFVVTHDHSTSDNSGVAGFQRTAA